MSKILKNNTSNAVSINDTGIAIPASGEYTISPQDYLLWASSNDVLSLITDETLIVNDGSYDLAISEGIDLLKGIFPSNIKVSQINSIPAFASKTVVVNGATKKLFARNTGFQQALNQGSNIITYTLTYPWCKILGVEVIGAETLDYCDFEVYDNAQGTYSGVPNYKLNQFAYSVNIPKDYYIRLSQFDADIYQGMVIKITYNSVSAKTVGFNIIMNELKD